MTRTRGERPSQRMSKEPGIGWLSLFLPDRSTGRASPIGLEDAQVCFEVGDRVGFHAGTAHRATGVIEKLNPKRARVRCADGAWAVPYAGLDHLCRTMAKERHRRVRRLRAVADEARDLLDRHGLEDWNLRFNGARGRLGECRFGRKLILLSRIHAAGGSDEQTTDTILHEIAHALAGPEAGHGPEWKAIAGKLGATPASCAPVSEEARRRRASAKARFDVGDTVSFAARGGRRTGTIVKMNPKRARVRCGDSVWSVPYARLDPGPDAKRHGD